MNSVFIYSITFYVVDDEYGHQDWCGTYTEVFPSRKAAEQFKKDWEEPKNLRSLCGSYLEGCDLNYWIYTGDSYKSEIREKEILDY